MNFSILFSENDQKQFDQEKFEKAKSTGVIYVIIDENHYVRMQETVSIQLFSKMEKLFDFEMSQT